MPLRDRTHPPSLYLDADNLIGNGLTPCQDQLADHIDCALLSAHAGHGSRGVLQVGKEGDSYANIQNISPRCRYFFLVSCAVMDHQGISPSLEEFTAFQNFLSWDVFARWSNGLEHGVRIIGGGVDSIEVNDHTLVNVFRNIYEYKLPIADAFLLATSIRGKISSCLTTGVDRPEATPLCTDRHFVDQVNSTKDHRYTFLQYPEWREPQKADDYWSFYWRDMENDYAEGRNESPPEEIRKASPPTIVRLRPLTLDGSDTEIGQDILNESVPEQLYNIMPNIMSSPPWTVSRSEDLGLLSVSLQIDSPPVELFDYREPVRDLVIDATEALGSRCMHFLDPSQTLEKAEPSREYIHMLIERTPLSHSAGPRLKKTYIKNEIARLKPRLSYRGEGGRVSIPILGSACDWLVRFTPPSDEPGRESIRCFEADIVVGGFEITEAQFVEEAEFVEFSAAKKLARNRFGEQNPSDERHYELDEESTRLGYRLVHDHRGPFFILTYRFHFQPIEEPRAGYQLDIPAVALEAKYYDLPPLTNP